MKGVGNGTVVGAYQRMAVPAVSGSKEAPAPAAPTGGAPAPQAAQVTISAEAKQLADGAGPVTDAQKVSHLKDQISAGAYHVDSHRVATRLIDGLI
jgi:flagellar biosynthesis anti-sigma factor FlgM